MSSAVARSTWATSSADRTLRPGPVSPAATNAGFGAMPASRAAASMRPTMPAEFPVASDEQPLDGTDTQAMPPVLVHPLRARASRRPVAAVPRSPRKSPASVTELTGMVRSSAAGRLACWDCSSAMDATTGTPRRWAASMACWAWGGLLMAPSASWTTSAPESRPNSTPAANRPPSAMNESATRTGRCRHVAQVPNAPVPLWAAVESRASPVPCPYSTSSSGSLSSLSTSQPEMSST